MEDYAAGKGKKAKKPIPKGEAREEQKTAKKTFRDAKFDDLMMQMESAMAGGKRPQISHYPFFSFLR